MVTLWVRSGREASFIWYLHWSIDGRNHSISRPATHHRSMLGSLDLQEAIQLEWDFKSLRIHGVRTTTTQDVLLGRGCRLEIRRGPIRGTAVVDQGHPVWASAYIISAIGYRISPSPLRMPFRLVWSFDVWNLTLNVARRAMICRVWKHLHTHKHSPKSFLYSYSTIKMARTYSVRLYLDQGCQH